MKKKILIRQNRQGTKENITDIMIKRSIHQEDLRILNIYCIQQKSLPDRKLTQLREEKLGTSIPLPP